MVLVVNNLALPEQYISTKLVKFCAKSTGIRASPYRRRPEMIIGQDNCNLIITREFYNAMNNNLIVDQSRMLLGWVIMVIAKNLKHK